MSLYRILWYMGYLYHDIIWLGWGWVGLWLQFLYLEISVEYFALKWDWIFSSISVWRESISMLVSVRLFQNWWSGDPRAGNQAEGFRPLLNPSLLHTSASRQQGVVVLVTAALARPNVRSFMPFTIASSTATRKHLLLLKDNIIYLCRQLLRLRTAVPSSTQHFLLFPPSSNIALPRQPQPCGCSSIIGVITSIVFTSLEFAASQYAPSLLYCCCSHVNLSPQCRPLTQGRLP